ncbi:HNH endonuclease [Gluconobacter sp. Dm-62]|uniref:HNH endonuclease n=1 Tax=Gluconobacter sp. Dm-62 TaxID=2799804 RepID=UPI001B8AF90E|nr:HNH endonuclease [Gluconobacter sp. Dm-62]MBS1102108.1 HNH endonuclease [Gluconobacter sp. Dm-62]
MDTIPLDGGSSLVLNTQYRNLLGLVMKLTRSAQNVLDYLVSILPSVRPGRPETFKTYGEVHRALGLPGIPHELVNQGLGTLADAVSEAGLPGITGLVVTQDGLVPGKGYFSLYGRQPDDFQWWEDEIKKVIAFDWSPYSQTAKPATSLKQPPKTPVASDGKKPERVETTTYRILRETLLARRVKELHKYACQICGETIELVDGRRYAEAHHIQPLGSPHNGPDELGNIICVCPNHHAMLDYFSISLKYNEIITHADHEINDEYISYHNKEHQIRKR